MARKWSTAEDNYMRENYPHMRSDKIAEKLNRSLRSVYSRANLLSLEKTPEFLKSPDSGMFVKGSTVGQAYRYPKGHIPVNKGKTMPKEVREKIKHTWFEKGHLPHNTKTDGEISVRKDTRTGIEYKYIRISLGEWKELHRHVWEKENGTIPKGMNVVFKDGNSLNCALENLEMISDAELCSRNTIHRYPTEIKETIRLVGKLKKEIRKYEKQD